ncbi:MAG: AMP-binding protein [Bradyrhizobium sp.]|nr:AMP-binding protein [Bradyrhizobium sp.]
MVEAICHHAAVRASSNAVRFLPAAGEPMELTFGELHTAAMGLAGMLRSQIRAGERVLMFYPPGLDFVIAFFGVLYAGGIAVPLVPPRRQGARPVIRALLADAQPSLVLTTSTFAPRVSELLREGASPLCSIATDEVALQDWEGGCPAPSPQSVCVLQYTSGSTGTPRGVMVTHDNVARNSRLLAQQAELDSRSVWVSWVPHFHDLGLFGSLCTPLYNGIASVLIPPAAFVARPVRWLEAITRYGGTVTVAPNFAYDLCTREISDEDCTGLDLSQWRVAGCGAEPIRMETMLGFAERFGRWGLSPKAMCPFYGLAEATLLVTGGPVGAGQTAATISSAALRENRVAPADSAEDGYAVPSCGVTSPDHRLVIVDPETRVPCRPHSIGEIWIDCSTVGPGYWNNAKETARVFDARTNTGEGPFLRTGDLGFVRDDILYVTGRIKDLIILRGQNIYPQDLEATVRAALPGVPEVAAFAVEGASTEQSVLVIEQPRCDAAEVHTMLSGVREALLREHGIEVHRIVLTRRRALPKTSSGKLQRAAARAALTYGTLPVIAEWRAESLLDDELGAGAYAVDFALRLKSLSSSEQLEQVENYLFGLLGELEAADPAACSRHETLIAMGMSSLDIMRLKRRIEAELMIALDAGSIWQEIGVADLAAHVLRALLATPLWANADAVERLADKIANMSDDEVRRELTA